MSPPAEAPLRILMHCVYFPPEVGGLESHVYYLARSLAARGHHVDMVTSRSMPGLPTREVMDGVHVHRTWFPSRNPLGWALHALGSIPLTRRLAETADVIHAQAFASVVPGLTARSVRGAPLLATWHTSHFLLRAREGVWPGIFRWMLTGVDRNLAASREIAAVGEALAPGVAVEPLTNGVETEIFRRVPPTLPPAPDGRRRIMVPRRLFPKNGVEYAIRALPLLRSRVDAEMVLVGDGPERGRLEALVREMGVADRVTFLGARPNQEMPGLLSSGDVALIPSLMEATSVAALECMSCELPVAASDVGGLPEIVDDTVGVLFPPADPVAMAAALARLLSEPALEQRGAAGRARVVAHWSNARLADRHLEIYRDLLAGRRGRRASSPSSRT